MTTDLNVDETFKKLQTHKGVKGILIINKNGSVIKSTFDNDTSQQYSKLILDLFPRASTLLKQNDEKDQVSFFRVRSQDNDIMVSPDNDYFLMVVNQVKHE
ncbi:cytoplasmic dynein light chain [Heterostelium album PN500]|uniref:Dynein light chain roadblock n=1 Tax=Heterostelium pallidum (strain ATCC 26659 / Pp 5 / PN500) TaxID=670386 RepID=D3BP63_HETP5|nr:cytoplasmic dynein light chain [Heterostelium album PN500]EFA77073.1 cytoplasmic dynein light chain [Heterostelium album PN500]|eukprot:XP_020429202.1 cytoplasmic dynein light chain [Heterostelium album PN500]